MKDITSEVLGEILMKARRLTCKDMSSIYIAASIMLEAEASPAEVVRYLEEHFMDPEAAT